MGGFRPFNLSLGADGEEEADSVAEVLVVGVVSEVDDSVVVEPVASGKLEIQKVNTLPALKSVLLL